MLVLCSSPVFSHWEAKCFRWVSAVMLHQQVLPPPPTPSFFLWNEFFAPGRPQRLSRQRSLTASRVSADGSTTFRGRDFVEPLVCSVQDMKSLRWCLLFDRTAKLFFVYFLMAGTLIVYHWPVRPKKVKLHYKYCIKRGKTEKIKNIHSKYKSPNDKE